MIKGKTPEEIRKTFNIKNDFTPEEEEEVRRENQVRCAAAVGWRGGQARLAGACVAVMLLLSCSSTRADNNPPNATTTKPQWAFD